MVKLLTDPKRCTKCEEHKPRFEFYPHSVAKNGVSAWCKTCTNTAAKERQKNDKPAARAASKKSKLKTKFGMTLKQYDTLLALQGGVCAICGTGRPGGMGRFPVDHCHTTGRIRGLLCNLCNIGLGHFKDDLARLNAAVAYLQGERLGLRS